MTNSYESVETIIHDHLKMSKVCARWVPRTSKQLKIGCAESHHLKSSWISSRLTKTILYDILLLEMKPGFAIGTRKLNKSRCSGDMIHLLHQENSKHRHQLARLWRHLILDSKGVLLIDYLPDKTTINGQYYANLLLKLLQAIKDKGCRMLTHGVWLLHDNSPVHKLTIDQQAVCDCGFLQLDHPAYSPDLAPSDYYLFRNMKSHLRGVRYSDNDSLKATVEAWLEGQTE